MGVMPRIRAATTADVATIGALIAAAFAEDEVLAQVWPFGCAGRAARMADYFAANVRLHHLPADAVTVAEDDDRIVGVVVCDPPGSSQPTPLGWARSVPSSVLSIRARLIAAVRLRRALDEAQPVQPHWYGALVATSPDHRRRGVARALIGHALRRCDAAGEPVFAVAPDPVLCPYLHSVGFRDAGGTIEVDGHELWPLWREPNP